MTIHRFMMEMNIMDMLLDDETLCVFPLGLDCRTLISV